MQQRSSNLQPHPTVLLNLSTLWDARHGPVRWMPTGSFGDRLRRSGTLRTSPYSPDWMSSMAGIAEEEGRLDSSSGLLSIPKYSGSCAHETDGAIRSDSGFPRVARYPALYAYGPRTLNPQVNQSGSPANPSLTGLLPESGKPGRWRMPTTKTTDTTGLIGYPPLWYTHSNCPAAPLTRCRLI